MAQSHFVYFTFHLLTFSSMLKLHTTPVTASCKFHTDAYKQYANLIARGQGTVPIHNLTCTCFVSTPQISILYPAADDSPDPDIEISPYDCQGVAWPCDEMPQTCAGIQENVFSYRSVSGIFNKTAVITCRNARDSNKADPFIVWVEPAVTSIASSSDTTSSSMTTTTTTTTIIIIATSSKVSSSPEMSTSIDYSTSVSPTTTSANNDCTVTVSTCISDPVFSENSAGTTTEAVPIAAIAGSISAVVVAVMIMISLIVLLVVHKKKQRQRDYEIPPPNTELQESIKLKNNDAK